MATAGDDHLAPKLSVAFIDAMDKAAAAGGVWSGISGAASRFVNAAKKHPMFAKAPMRAAPTRPFLSTVGGQPMRVNPDGSGLVDTYDASGRRSWRAPTTGPEMRDINARSQAMSSFERHRLAVRMGQKQDSGIGRLAARGADVLKHPAMHVAAPLAAGAVMSMIPAGRDEYGNRRSLAQTGIGSMAAGIGIPLAMAAAPAFRSGSPGVFARAARPAAPAAPGVA